MYKIKLVTNSKHTVKDEQAIKDLCGVASTLKKHNVGEEVSNKIRTLRNKRRSKEYVLEVSRNFRGAPLLASTKIATLQSKMEAVKKLKKELREQVKTIRAEQAPPIETREIVPGVSIKMLGECYMEPGAFFKAMNRKVRNEMINGSRKPNTGDHHIGVEIELASKQTREVIADKLADAGLAKYVSIGTDGSIHAGQGVLKDYKYGHELRIIVKQHEYKDVLSKICKVLEGCEVAVDKTCGLHVHLDMRNRQVEHCYSNLAAVQHFLYAMLPANRKNSTYSKPVPSRKMKDNTDRYYGLNIEAYKKYKTLEVRMHSGTTDAAKITNWIGVLLAVIEAPAIIRQPAGLKTFRKYIPISDELVKYMEARMNKFAEQHAKIPLNSALEGNLAPFPESADDTITDTCAVEESEAA